jgi:hypothetical protein
MHVVEISFHLNEKQSKYTSILDSNDNSGINYFFEGARIFT